MDPCLLDDYVGLIPGELCGRLGISVIDIDS